MAEQQYQQLLSGALRLTNLQQVATNVVEGSQNELQQLVHQLPGQSDADRKQALLLHLHGTRQRLLRLLVVSQWANKAKAVVECGKVLDVTARHAHTLSEAADKLVELHEELENTRTPIFDVPTALDVLQTGSYNILPQIIEDLRPPVPPPPRKRRAAVRLLDQLLRSQLLKEDLPLGVEVVTVSGGSAVLRSEGEYEAKLTLDGAGASGAVAGPATDTEASSRKPEKWRWRLLSFTMLPGYSDGRLLWPQQSSQLQAAIESRMWAAANVDHPLQIMHNVLQGVAGRLLLNEAVTAVRALLASGGRWHGHARMDTASHYSTGIRLSYWLQAAACNAHIQLAALALALESRGRLAAQNATSALRSAHTASHRPFRSSTSARAGEASQHGPPIEATSTLAAAEAASASPPSAAAVPSGALPTPELQLCHGGAVLLTVKVQLHTGRFLLRSAEVLEGEASLDSAAQLKQEEEKLAAIQNAALRDRAVLPAGTTPVQAATERIAAALEDLTQKRLYRDLFAQLVAAARALGLHAAPLSARTLRAFMDANPFAPKTHAPNAILAFSPPPQLPAIMTSAPTSALTSANASCNARGLVLQVLKMVQVPAILPDLEVDDGGHRAHMAAVIRWCQERMVWEQLRLHLQLLDLPYSEELTARPSKAQASNLAEVVDPRPARPPLQSSAETSGGPAEGPAADELVALDRSMWLDSFRMLEQLDAALPATASSTARGAGAAGAPLGTGPEADAAEVALVRCQVELRPQLPAPVLRVLEEMADEGEEALLLDALCIVGPPLLAVLRTLQPEQLLRAGLVPADVTLAMPNAPYKAQMAVHQGGSIRLLVKLQFCGFGLTWLALDSAAGPNAQVKQPALQHIPGPVFWVRSLRHCLAV
ncbi:hypothetical protein WJX72_006563 [[Myrmecia] bisecta]|uniref:Mediator of RNA polymerase II transcription subunit 14 n=1 Tax=[Myrmecia] bisecta TaxID=41462 RepID=A0AAW1PAX6_9CHLO